MKKRAFLAMALSLGVLFLWQTAVQKMYHIDNKTVTSGEPQQIPPVQIDDVISPLSSAQDVLKSSVPESFLGQIETAKVKLEYSNPGARVNKIFVKDYNIDSDIKGSLYLKSMENDIYIFKDNVGAELSISKNGHFNVQKLTSSNTHYFFNLEIIFKNLSDLPWKLKDKLVIATIAPNAKAQEAQLSEVVLFAEDTTRKNPLGIKGVFVSQNTLKAIGYRDRYTCIIVSPQDSQQSKGYIEKSTQHSVEVGLDIDEFEISPKGQKVFNYLVYVGPQDKAMLKQANQGFEGMVYHGTFDFISTTLLSVMQFFHKLFGNWGIALILLSIFIYGCTYPLTLKQMRSMKEMQELQPQIQALQRNHKDNPQRLNKEIMELYRKHKVNPLGGCLPMILQIPVFFGLYQALSRAIVLKGSKFLWIKDLAEPDKLFQIAKPVPFIGTEINLLPILMALGMFLQQKMSMKSSATSPEMREQQKIMVIIFPIMMGFVFYHFPSGLALYWFMNTALSILSQWKILKAKELAKA